MGHAREKNIGWRIDYFVVSKSIINNVSNAMIYDEVQGSDHCPVRLDVEL
jgi:exodeoxyribonuclease-3